MAKEYDAQIDRKALGYRIYMARTEANMQVGMLAGIVGISEIFLRQIELGRKLPSLTLLVNICNVLHVSPAYFLASDLSLDLDDPVQMTIDTISDCSPREAAMIVEMISGARKHLLDKSIVKL